jgi:hypothetical protein
VAGTGSSIGTSTAAADANVIIVTGHIEIEAVLDWDQAMSAVLDWEQSLGAVVSLEPDEIKAIVTPGQSIDIDTHLVS